MPVSQFGRQPQLDGVGRVEWLDTNWFGALAMTAGHWKVSHIVSIAAMAALLSFFVFSAFAGESSPLLSSTTTQSSAVAQSAADVATIDRAS